MTPKLHQNNTKYKIISIPSDTDTYAHTITAFIKQALQPKHIKQNKEKNSTYTYKRLDLYTVISLLYRKKFTNSG